MNPIDQAEQLGYSEDQILNFLSQKYPHVTKKISQARSIGYNAQTILNFLAPFFSSDSNRPRASSQQAGHALRRKEDIDANKRLVQTAANVGLTFAGGAAAGRGLKNVLPTAADLLSRKQTSSQAAPQNASQDLETSATQTQQTTPTSGLNILNQMGITPRIQNMLQAGNPPKVVASAVKSMLSPSQKTWLKSQTDQPIEELVDEYMQSDQTQQAPKSKLALLPSGQVGDLVDERQGIATLELPDGKKRIGKIDDLIYEPEDAAEIALELIKSFTPEEERSAHHALSFYDPDDKHAFFMFHGGDAYRVEDISPDEYKQLSQEIVGAKTTGQALRGEWSAGSGSRGAAYHQIVKLGNKPYKKLQVGYDLFRQFQKRINESQKKRKKTKR